MVENSKSGENDKKRQKTVKIIPGAPSKFFPPAGPHNRDSFADSGIHKSRLWNVIYSNHANAIPLEIQDFN